MQIVIDIPKEDYEGIIGTKSYASKFNLVKAMKEAIILPKGHGRLIDISEYEKYFNTEITYDDGNHIHSVYANTISTIIEADKKESEDKR